MKIILVSLVILSALSTKAQPDNSQKTQTDSLHYKVAFFRMYPVMYNNGLELKKGEAKALISKVPESFELYKKYINRNKAGLYSFAGLLAGLTSSTLGFDNDNKGLMAIGLTTAIVSLYSGIYFFISSDAKLRKAIKMYNNSVKF